MSNMTYVGIKNWKQMNEEQKVTSLLDLQLNIWFVVNVSWFVQMQRYIQNLSEVCLKRELVCNFGRVERNYLLISFLYVSYFWTLLKSFSNQMLFTLK